MQVTTTFRHMESSQPVRRYALDRLSKVRKCLKRQCEEFTAPQVVTVRASGIVPTTVVNGRKCALPLAPAAPPLDVVQEETPSTRSLRVDDAVMQLSLGEAESLVRRGGNGGLISSVYRPKDGRTGEGFRQICREVIRKSVSHE